MGSGWTSRLLTTRLDPGQGWWVCGVKQPQTDCSFVFSGTLYQRKLLIRLTVILYKITQSFPLVNGLPGPVWVRG